MMMNSAYAMRLVSICIPLFFIILGTLFFPGSQQYWVFILVVTMCAGYVHFFIGTLYQLESIAKKPDRNVNLLLFSIISILAFLTCRVFIEYDLEIILGAFTIIYFIFHVLLNEKTFLHMQLGINMTYPEILSLSALIVPPFLLALVHPSFFYDFSLKYPSIDSLQYRQIIEVFISMDFLFVVSLCIVGTFLIVVPYRLLQHYGFWPFLLSSLGGLFIFLLILYKVPFHFVYLLHFVLMFHFVLLFFIFLQYFYNKNPKFLSRYIMLHSGALVVIVGIALIPVLMPHNNILYKIYASVFNFGSFLTISIMHVSVSFLNEVWFIKILKKII